MHATALEQPAEQATGFEDRRNQVGDETLDPQGSPNDVSFRTREHTPIPKLPSWPKLSTATNSHIAAALSPTKNCTM